MRAPDRSEELARFEIFLERHCHRLRGLLGTLANRVHLLARTSGAGDGVEALRASIERIETHAARAERFLAASRLPRDGGPTDVTAVARAVVATLAREGAAAADDFVVTDLPGVACPREVVETLLREALENALAHGRPPVRIEGGGDEADGVHIDVIDAAEGLAGPVEGRALRPHAGADEGVGLAVIDHLARRHGGHAALDSAADGGTRLRLVLPAAD